MKRLFYALLAMTAGLLLVTQTHEFAWPDLLVPASSSPAPAPTATASSGPTVKYGDLTHLQYTATANLTASIISPRADFASSSSALQVTVGTIKGAGVELRINNTLVPSKQLGEQTIDNKSGETRYTYYGVALQPGPNMLSAVAIGADGARGTEVFQTVYGPGDPDALVISTRDHVVADGKTPFTVSVLARDQWHHAASSGARIQFSVLSGNVRVVDAQTQAVDTNGNVVPTAPPTGVNDVAITGLLRYNAVIGEGGVANIQLVPGVVAGPVELDVQLGRLHQRATFYLYPNLRKPFVNGVLTLGSGAVPGSVDGDGVPDSGNSRKHGGGLYATGRIGNSALLTMVYSGQSRLAPLSSVGPFVEDPNDRPYLTYGDNSTVSNPMRSNDHLYARLENARGSLMWGQYSADTGFTDVGGYHQLLSGARADFELAHGAAHAMAFTARNNVAFISQLLPALGLSSLSQTLHPDIVVGSDYLQLVAFDRRTGAVISQTPLVRNVDYSIDYATGVLRFINIPLPYDPNFNPQSISIQYQYQGPGIQSQTTGGSLVMGFGATRSTKLRLGYVNDATGTQNYSLLSEQLTHSWTGGSFTMTHAGSYGYVPDPSNPTPLGNRGNAYSVNFDVHGSKHDFLAYWQQTTAGYNDPFGGVSTPGLTNYRADWRYHPSKTDALEVTYSGQNNVANGVVGSQSDAAITWHHQLFKKLMLTLGLDQHTQRVGNPATPVPLPSATPTYVVPSNTTQTVAQIGLAYKPSDRVSVSVERDQTLSGSDVGSTQPSQTRVEASVATGNHGRFYVRDLQTDYPAATYANASSATTLGIASTNTLQFGFQQDLSKNTNITEDYTVAHTGSGTQIVNAVGVQQKLQFGKHLSGNAFFQRASGSGQDIQGFSVYGLSLAYSNEKNLRIGGAYQNRSGIGGGSTYTFGVAGRLSPVLSAVGSFQHAFGASTFVNDRISIAHRPANNDRLISLFNYTRTNGTGSPGALNNVISFEELYRPWESLELSGRYAFKISGDGFYAAHTSLIALRAKQNIGKLFDIGGEYREYRIPGINNSQSTDFATEAGYQLGTSARLAVGYNFSHSVDPTLTGQPQKKGLYVTFTTLVDRVFGWGAHP